MKEGHPRENLWRIGRVLLCFLVTAFSQRASGEEFVVLEQKHVLVDKSIQMLRAYEGARLVFECRVSTGRWDGATPNGLYVAGDKSRMHYSRLFHHAPMPYSVYVTGNVFIHGFAYVPAWPDSHGCIRVPLGGENPARRLFGWIEPGTPIEIVGHWNGRKLASRTP